MAELSIDDRLKFLLTSTESLHASCQELHAASVLQAEGLKRLAEEQRQQSKAMLAAIRAYLDGMDGTND